MKTIRLYYQLGGVILLSFAVLLCCYVSDVNAAIDKEAADVKEVVISARFPVDATFSSKTITAIEDRIDNNKRTLQPKDAGLTTDEGETYINTNESQNLSHDKPGHAPLGIRYRDNNIASRAIDKNIVFFSERLKERFSIWLERSARYLEIMKDILAERGLPEELVFLPIIESGFNMNAYSRASAVGPWQFIAGTAKRYGLTIDWWRDERKDPVKSTEAAANYLRDLYKMFGAWHLALAAYNAGEGRIMRALKSTGADDYWDLLKTRKIHPETKEYVPRYIAATKIARTPHNYGFEGLDYHEPFDFEEVTITEPLDIDIIALAAETTPKVIRELNPELRRWCTPFNERQYTIRVPVGSKELFFENLETIPKEERVSVDTYIIQKGDTIKKVAQKTGFPVGVILAMNSLEGIESLKPGERLNLPPKDKFVLDLDDKKERHKNPLVKKAAYKKTEPVKKNTRTSKKKHLAKNKTKR